MRPGGGPNPIPRRPTGSARRVCHCRVSRLVTWRSSTPSGDNGRPQALTTTATHHLPPATNALQPEAGPCYFFIFQENPRLLFSPRLLLPSFQLKCLQYIMPITVARLNRRGPSRFRSSRLTFLSPAPLLMNAFASINTATQVFPASSIKLFNALFETRHRTAIVIAVLLDP